MIVSELEALSACHQVEGMVVLVHRSLNIPMEPKFFATNKPVNQHLQIHYHAELNKFTGTMESAMIGNNHPWNSSNNNYKQKQKFAKTRFCSRLSQALIDATAKMSAVMEYAQYESLVIGQFNVKLVGWEHNKWGNPGGLKGGLIPLMKLADVVESGQCHFVPISDKEVEERCQHIKAGEVLTLDKEPPYPLPPANPALANSNAASSVLALEGSPLLADVVSLRHPLSSPPPSGSSTSSGSPSTPEETQPMPEHSIPPAVAAIFAQIRGRLPPSSDAPPPPPESMLLPSVDNPMECVSQPDTLTAPPAKAQTASVPVVPIATESKPLVRGGNCKCLAKPSANALANKHPWHSGPCNAKAGQKSAETMSSDVDN
ncbi:hypothetical protein CONPUDRAFT_158809 [Coniophora puteana RWD-64-598 SS2]|uniref:Uncharacterized protein n=1 Tax=Coniophora puteana (strain RWD-64-598) TaxID=741705 RepID=A0A5M3M9W0_CONPW|nr:uncharacterized protein CONPUDRAFT_158809 [Coniophora puteana RWD-64-598 SS2]EIW76038.1 hypothetical protein CONPUDRAFT_158809 [Coniophora puteana RWD-64-598 SS2]